MHRIRLKKKRIYSYALSPSNKLKYSGFGFSSLDFVLLALILEWNYLSSSIKVRLSDNFGRLLRYLNYLACYEFMEYYKLKKKKNSS